LYQWLVKLKED